MPQMMTVARPTSAASSAALEHAIRCAHLAEGAKAKDIVVLDMRGLTSLYDYLVIATGAGKRQLHAIAEEIDDYMKSQGDSRLGIEGYEACRWIVQDYGDVVMHLFDSASREYYALDDLWADAPRIDWQRM